MTRLDSREAFSFDQELAYFEDKVLKVCVECGSLVPKCGETVLDCPECGEDDSLFLAEDLEADDGQPDEMQEWEGLADAGYGTDEDYGCFDSEW